MFGNIFEKYFQSLFLRAEKMLQRKDLCLMKLRVIEALRNEVVEMVLVLFEDRKSLIQFLSLFL